MFPAQASFIGRASPGRFAGRCLPAVVGAFVVLAGTSAEARELPTASELFGRLGFSEHDQRRAFRGELVSRDGAEISSRDLSIVMAYVVDTQVASFVDEFSRGADYRDDPHVTAFGVLDDADSADALAEMKLDPERVDWKRLYSSPDSRKVNFSSEETEALGQIEGDQISALERQIRSQMLERFRAYRANGLAGIPAYQRPGRLYSPADDLIRAVDSARILDEYAPSFQRTLREYPHFRAPGLREQFLWVNFELDGLPTFVLNHRLSLELADGVHVMAERHFYVSRSHNAVQIYGGLFPVEEGTVVFYASRVFTDRAAGFASGVKHALGRRTMARRYGRILESYRARRAEPQDDRVTPSP